MYTEKNVKIFLLCRMEAFAFLGVSYILAPQWENTIGDITSTEKKILLHCRTKNICVTPYNEKTCILKHNLNDMMGRWL